MKDVDSSPLILPTCAQSHPPPHGRLRRDQARLPLRQRRGSTSVWPLHAALNHSHLSNNSLSSNSFAVMPHHLTVMLSVIVPWSL